MCKKLIHLMSFVLVLGLVGNAGGQGLTGDYFNNQTLTDPAVLTRIENVDFDWGNGSPDASVPVNNFSARWSGAVVPEFTEAYTFRTRTDDGVRLWVDDQLVIDNWTDHAPTWDAK